MPILRQTLSDTDTEVRIASLLWAGESWQVTEKDRSVLRSHLPNSLTSGAVNERLFDTYLAAVENLDAQFAESYVNRAEPRSKKLQRRLPAKLLTKFVESNDWPVAVRAQALKRMDSLSARKIAGYLRQYLEDHDDALALAIIDQCFEPKFGQQLLKTLVRIARDPQRSESLRCESLLALSYFPAESFDVTKLVFDPNPQVATEALPMNPPSR
jgi:hypothetical protein